MNIHKTIWFSVPNADKPAYFHRKVLCWLRKLNRKSFRFEYISNKLHGRTVFIAGSDKNAGKTTFLNLALESLRKIENPAYLTIGIDGERTDQIFGTPKPRILAIENDYLVTTDSMLKESSGSFEILQVFPDKTVLGRIVLAKVIRNGYIELVGAEDNSGLAKILYYLKKEQKIDTVLIDGAVNRITQVVSGENAAFVYIAKITPNNFNATVEKIKIINLLSTLPSADILTVAEKANLHYHYGALTQAKLKALPEECSGLVFEDFTRFFLSYEELKKVLEKQPVYLETAYELLFFQVNNYDTTQDQIKAALNDESIFQKIVFNPHCLGTEAQRQKGTEKQ